MRRDLGLRLRILRETLGLSLEEMAEACFIHAAYLGELERGKHTAGVWTVAKIAWGAGVDTGSLVAGLRPPIDHPTRPAPT